MKLWQQPPQQLPVKVRPLHLETLISYATRLAAANELARPTILIRALGQPHGNLAATTMHDYDLALNPLALARLETFTGIPAARLRKSLPAVNFRSGLAADIPRTQLQRAWGLRRPCDGCAARVPGKPTILTYRQEFPAICVRHRRWLDGDKHQQRPSLTQIDMSRTPEILNAHRRYLRLRDRIAATDEEGGGTGSWFWRQMLTATEIVKAWVSQSRYYRPRMHEVWRDRTTALWPWQTATVGSDVLVFPEAVALGEIITDLEWRRHVAMVRYENDLARFFRRVAARLGQPPKFANTLQYSSSQDPLRHWVNQMRRAHETRRTEFFARFDRLGLRQEPFPEIRHFK